MPPLFLGLTSLPNSLPPLSERHRGTGMGVAVSSAHIFPAASSSSGGDSSHSSPAPTWSSLQQETALHKLLQHELLPQAAALHELPQHGSFPWGAVLQEQAAPAWVPHRVTSPASKPAPAWAPLSTGPQVLSGPCSSAGSPRGHSLLQASACSSVGSLPWATGGYLLHRGPPWTAEEQPASPSRVAREGSLLPTFQAPPPPSFFTDLGVCRGVSLTYSHASLLLQNAITQGFSFSSLTSYYRNHCH